MSGTCGSRPSLTAGLWTSHGTSLRITLSRLPHAPSPSLLLLRLLLLVSRGYVARGAASGYVAR
eukprot:878586-Rhodomonas_salina.1